MVGVHGPQAEDGQAEITSRRRRPGDLPNSAPLGAGEHLTQNAADDELGLVLGLGSRGERLDSAISLVCAHFDDTDETPAVTCCVGFDGDEQSWHLSQLRAVFPESAPSDPN